MLQNVPLLKLVWFFCHDLIWGISLKRKITEVQCHFYHIIFFKKDFIYLFLERGERGRKRWRETSLCGYLSHAPYWGPWPQPRHVPWLGIESVTLWFAGRHSINWATPARIYHIISRVHIINMTYDCCWPGSPVCSNVCLLLSYSFLPFPYCTFRKQATMHSPHLKSEEFPQCLKHYDFEQ